MGLDIIANLSASGGGSITNSANGANQPIQIGSGILPDLVSAYTYGTDDYQVNAFYAANRTVLAGATDSLNLTTGPNALCNTFSLTKLKLLIVAILSPDGVNKLRVGPQGVTNAAQLWFGGVGATVYDELLTYRVWENPFGGYAVTATTGDILPIKNPGGADITYGIWLLGLD